MTLHNLTLNRLKDFSSKNLYSTLNKILNTIEDDFLSKSLITRKLLKKRINSICYCKSKEYSTINYLCDNEGEITTEKKEILYSDDCGIFLVCPLCARKRTDIIKAKYGERCRELSAKYPYVYMITYTIEDTENFNDGWELITKSLRRFRRIGQKRKAGGRVVYYGESGKIKAALSCGEVKEGSGSGRWHVHFHQIAFCSEPLDYSIYDQKKKQEIITYYNEVLNCEALKIDLVPAVKSWLIKKNKTKIPISKVSLEWYFSTGKTSTNIDVRPVDSSKILETIPEIIKYSSKVNELPPDKLLEILLYKDHKRFLSTWGEMRDNNEPETIEEEEPVEVSEENINLDVAIQAVIYDIKKGEYRQGDIEEMAEAEELYKKRDQLIEFKKAVNTARHYKNKLLDNIKKSDMVFLQPDDIEKRKQIIKDVDSIDSAYRAYIKELFKRKVSLDLLKLKKKRLKILNQREKFYYECFCNLEKVG